MCTCADISVYTSQCVINLFAVSIVAIFYVNFHFVYKS